MSAMVKPKDAASLRWMWISVIWLLYLRFLQTKEKRRFANAGGLVAEIRLPISSRS